VNTSKLERVNKLIGFLIFTGQLSLKATQQQIAAKMNYNKSSTTKALNGYEDYLTDSFIKKFNEAFGNPFENDWLIEGIGVPCKNITCGDIFKSVVVNGDVQGDIDNSNKSIDVQQISDLNSCIDYIKQVVSNAFQRDQEKEKRIIEKDEIIKRKDEILEIKNLQIKEAQHRINELTNIIIKIKENGK
jgi:hypothetical protein